MDEQLVVRIRQNDQRAMSQLYQRYVGILTSVCYRYVVHENDVKDVLQNSFVKIFTSLSKFEFRGEESLRVWMTRIVVNESLNFLQNRKKMRFVEDETKLLDLPDEEEVSLDRISDEELHQLIRELPDGYRTVLNLFVFEGLSHRQIAELLSIKESTSASQFYFAKRLLAKRIKDLKNKKE